MLEQHQRQQAQHFGMLRGRHVGVRLADQKLKHTAEADGVVAQFVPDQGVPGSGGIAFGEDQIEDGEDGVEPFGQQMRGRDVVGDAGVFNFALGPHQPLGHGGHGQEKGGGDLGGGEAAQRLQGEGDLLLHRQGGVTTGEDQLETFVGNLVEVVEVLGDGQLLRRQVFKLPRFNRG